MLIKLHIPLIMNERHSFRIWRCQENFKCKVRVDLSMQKPGIMKDKSSGGQIFSWKQGAHRFDGNMWPFYGVKDWR